jgi:hypothetical protein
MYQKMRYGRALTHHQTPESLQREIAEFQVDAAALIPL